MKCGIITVYNSQNCGSYLQAYALIEYLNTAGKNAVCIEHCFLDRSTSRVKIIKAVVINIFRGRFFDSLIPVKQNNVFRNSYRKMRIEKLDDNIDIIILGSDTIWDVSTPYFRNHHDFFWGTTFSGKRIISYAPSIGYSKKEHLEACPWIAEALRGMDMISVRDTGAMALLQPYCDQKISLVCDPTFLLMQEQYMQIATEVKEDNFIFLYYYGHMAEMNVNQLKVIADQEGLKIITFGGSNRWCDQNEPYDPLRFLGLYNKAKYVVTNTFHGTVFAHIFKKKFAVLHSEKPKIIDLLNRMGTSDKSTFGGRKIADILASEFCYEEIEQHIEAERATGIAYLDEALGVKK